MQKLAQDLEKLEETGSANEDNEPLNVPELTQKLEEVSEIRELQARVDLLERKAMIACQICSQICPQKAVDRVEKLDAQSSGFTIKQSITISGAREIQRVYGQIVALALGHEASLLYKVSKKQILFWLSNIYG